MLALSVVSASVVLGMNQPGFCLSIGFSHREFTSTVENFGSGVEKCDAVSKIMTPVSKNVTLGLYCFKE